MAKIPLTDSRLKQAIAEANKLALNNSQANQSITDSGGLTLMRQNSGAWIWFFRYYRPDGKRTRMSFGSYPLISLATARSKHREAKELLSQGIDPVYTREEEHAKRKIDTVNSFESVTRQWFDLWKVGKNKENARKTMMRIEKDLFPVFGKRPITSLVRPEVILPPLKAISERGAVEIARRMFGTCRNVFEHAYIHGMIEQNPLAGITVGKVLKGQKETHHPRVNESELPKLLNDIDNYDGKLARIGLQLMTLVFVRHSELIGARWEDFDFDKKLWTIPASIEDESGEKTYGMKMGTVHYVPLSKQAIALLHELQEITGGRQHLFPSTKGDGKTMSMGTMNKALDIMGYKGRQDVHGFRGLASTILNERDRSLRDIVELQLSHLTGNSTERAYNAAEHMDDRTKMMQDWADYIDEQRLLGKQNLKRA